MSGIFKLMGVLGVLGASMGIAALGCWALIKGWFQWLLLGEAVIVGGLFVALRAFITRKPWVEE